MKKIEDVLQKIKKTAIKERNRKVSTTELTEPAVPVIVVVDIEIMFQTQPYKHNPAHIQNKRTTNPALGIYQCLQTQTLM